MAERSRSGGELKMNLFETELSIACCGVVIFEGTTITVNALTEGELLLGAWLGVATQFCGGIFMILMRKRERIINERKE